MDCKQTRKWLTAQVDGELGVTEMIAIEHHLAVCAECNRLFAEQVRISSAMKNMPLISLRQLLLRSASRRHYLSRNRQHIPQNAGP